MGTYKRSIPVRTLNDRRLVAWTLSNVPLYRAKINNADRMSRGGDAYPSVTNAL